MPPLADAELTPAQMAAKAAIIDGPRGRFEGPFVPLLRSPDLMGRLEKVGEYLRFGSGLSGEVIAAVAEGRRPEGMAEDEQVVWDFVFEIFAKRRVSDVTYGRAAQKFGEDGVIDLTCLCGYYGLLALVMNVAQTPPPEGADRLG